MENPVQREAVDSILPLNELPAAVITLPFRHQIGATLRRQTRLSSIH